FVDGCDVFVDDQSGALGGGSGDDVQCLALGLVPAVDGRVGAEEGCVDLSGEQGVDGVRPGVEGLCGQLDVIEGVGEDPAPHTDECGCVGDVGEVAKCQGSTVEGRGVGGPTAGGGQCQGQCRHGCSGYAHRQEVLFLLLRPTMKLYLISRNSGTSGGTRARLVPRITARGSGTAGHAIAAPSHRRGVLGAQKTRVHRARASVHAGRLTPYDLLGHSSSTAPPSSTMSPSASTARITPCQESWMYSRTCSSCRRSARSWIRSSSTFSCKVTRPLA